MALVVQPTNMNVSMDGSVSTCAATEEVESLMDGCLSFCYPCSLRSIHTRILPPLPSPFLAKSLVPITRVTAGPFASQIERRDLGRVVWGGAWESRSAPRAAP